MSGHNVPYQLRTNKYVERQLFLDILDFVRVWNGPSRYLYASMGGRFLEDFKLVNNRFAIEHMVSIEMDVTTWRRQTFNRLGFVDCKHQSSGEFVEELDRLMQVHQQRRLIVWLDFAVANERGSQLGEFRQLISKLGSGDVAKITLNANHQSYRRRASLLLRKDFDAYLKDADLPTRSSFDSYIASVVAPSNVQQEVSLALTDTDYDTICMENLKEQLGEYLPSGGIAAGHLSTTAFASFLAESVKIAALKGVEGSKLQPVPLGVFRYRDGEHQMLTVTIVLADEALATSIAGDSVFLDWPFRAAAWGEVHEVNVPDLSAKERHLIEGLISSNHDADKIHGEIPFRFDKKDANSLALLVDYLRHYRRYPTFARIQ